MSSEHEVFFGNDCAYHTAGFLAAYSEIDFKSFGNLQHFRNCSLVHISSSELERHVTYDELGRFVVIVSKLAEHLTLVVKGLNDNHVERLIDLSERLQKWWQRAAELGKRDHIHCLCKGGRE
jgi:hypothetical protein